MNLGCGNSVLSEELYDRGFKQVFNIDISPVVIEQMAKRNSVSRPELKCKVHSCKYMTGEVMDVRNMHFPSDYFDLIIDKSTIDALLCGESAFINTALMMRECQRVLKVDGAYMGISYGNPENRVLHYKRGHLKMTVQTYQVAPAKDSKDQQSVHFVYVCKKIEGAEAHCAANWDAVEAQIRKEELDEDEGDLLGDDEEEEEEEGSA